MLETCVAGNLTPFDVVTTSASVTFPAVDNVIASESPTEPIVPPFAIDKLDSVPTEVKLDAVTVDFKVLPLSVPAAAVTVIAPVPSKSTPLIARAVASAVAVAALPEVS